MLNKLYEMLNNKYNAKFDDESMVIYFDEKEVYLDKENNKIEVYAFDNNDVDQNVYYGFFNNVKELYEEINSFLEN